MINVTVLDARCNSFITVKGIQRGIDGINLIPDMEFTRTKPWTGIGLMQGMLLLFYK